MGTYTADEHGRHDEAHLDEAQPDAAAGPDVAAGTNARSGPGEAQPADGPPGTVPYAGQLVAPRAATGDLRVDAALERLDELADLPVSEHRDVFEHIHRSLTDVLGELDTGVQSADQRGPGGPDGRGGPGGGHGGGANAGDTRRWPG